MKKMGLSEELIDILDVEDWHVYTDEHSGDWCAEVSKYSPAGEDFVATIWYDGTDDGFINSFVDYAESFDAEEHAAMWIDGRGKNGVPDSIREILDDAEAIDAMLTDMARILANGRVA